MNLDFLLIFLFFAALVFLASQITTKMISNMKLRKSWKGRPATMALTEPVPSTIRRR